MAISSIQLLDPSAATLASLQTLKAWLEALAAILSMLIIAATWLVVRLVRWAMRAKAAETAMRQHRILWRIVRGTRDVDGLEQLLPQLADEHTKTRAELRDLKDLLGTSDPAVKIEAIRRKLQAGGINELVEDPAGRRTSDADRYRATGLDSPMLPAPPRRTPSSMRWRGAPPDDDE